MSTVYRTTCYLCDKTLRAMSQRRIRERQREHLMTDEHKQRLDRTSVLG